MVVRVDPSLACFSPTPSPLFCVSRSSRCGHAPAGWHDITRCDARFGALASLPYPTHRRSPSSPSRRPLTHPRMPTDDVGVFCSCESRHTARGLLCHCVGTAAVIIPAARIGWQRRVGGDDADADAVIQDIVACCRRGRKSRGCLILPYPLCKSNTE